MDDIKGVWKAFAELCEEVVGIFLIVIEYENLAHLWICAEEVFQKIDFGIKVLYFDACLLDFFNRSA